MKLTIIGGASARTPGIYEELHERGAGLDIDELVLHDLDEARLARIDAVLAGMDQERGTALRRRTETDLGAAVEGADFVYCSIRVGGLAGRVVDEAVAVAAGTVGQETTGPGGICFALRSVPAVTRIAAEVAERAPEAWLINFTNPAGLVTEAAQRVVGERAIGICDAPPDLCRRLAGALDRPVDQLWFHYFGLNHLGWVGAVYDGGRDLLPELLADERRLNLTDEGRLFGARWLRNLGLFPNEYLYYYYATPEVIGAMREATRSEFLIAQQDRFFEGDGTPSEALAQWRATMEERESTYMREAWEAAELEAPATAGEPDGAQASSYGRVALDVLEGLSGRGPRVRIVNTANRGALPYLDDEAVVEVPSLIDAGGVHPMAMGDAPLEARGLIESVKAVDRVAIDAALRGSRELALKALALHPLVPSVGVAEQILDGYLERQPGLAEALR